MIVVFTAGGALLLYVKLTYPPYMPWSAAGTVLCGLGIVVALFVMWLARTELVLTPRDLTIGTMFRTHRIELAYLKSAKPDVTGLIVTWIDSRGRDRKVISDVGRSTIFWRPARYSGEAIAAAIVAARSKAAAGEIAAPNPDY